MPRTTRTFIALPVPAPAGEKLLRLQARLAPELPSVRWTTTLPFHMTLAFLGDVPDTDLNSVCQAVAGASEPFAPLELSLLGLGAFPAPARPRVLWAGLSTGEMSRLAELRQAVVKAVTRAGYRPDDQRFTPHVTLGRLRGDRRGPPPPDLTDIVAAHQAWAGGTFKAGEVVTYASTLGPHGPAYAPLARGPLRGRGQKRAEDIDPA